MKSLRDDASLSEMATPQSALRSLISFLDHLRAGGDVVVTPSRRRAFLRIARDNAKSFFDRDLALHLESEKAIPDDGASSHKAEPSSAMTVARRI